MLRAGCLVLCLVPGAVCLVLVRVHFAAPIALVADVTPAAAVDLALAPGAEVWCAVKATAIQVHAV